MENLLKYYEFSDFFEDQSDTFSSPITFTELNSHHFLIFENKDEVYTLYVAKYENRNQIGKSKPEILELLVDNYDKSNSDHRVLLRSYLD